MITVGIDLAAQPKNTAVCTLRWDEQTVELLELALGVDNDGSGKAPTIVAGSERGQSGLAGRVAPQSDELSETFVVGIDAPFGWPGEFVQAVSEWHGARVWNQPAAALDADAKQRLLYRQTDRWIKQTHGITPLSVSSDRIATVTWRAAELLTTAAGGHDPIWRNGYGTGASGQRFVEVYPAATLASWGIDRKGYKASDALKKRDAARTRAKIVKQLGKQLVVGPELRRAIKDGTLAASDHAVDAFVSALAARAAELGLTTGPTPEAAADSVVEGWIHVPSPTSLGSLVTAALSAQPFGSA